MAGIIRILSALGICVTFGSTTFAGGSLNDWLVLKGQQRDSLISLLLDAKRYSSMESRFMVKSYATHETTLLEDAEEGQFILDGSNSWSTLMGLETIADGQMAVTIDNQNKELMISEIDSEFNEQLFLSWKEYLSIKGQLFWKREEQFQTIRIEMPKGAQFEAIEMRFNYSNEVSRVAYYFAYGVQHDPTNGLSPITKPRLEIEFTTSIYGQTKLPETKKISGVVSVTNSLVKPVGKYSHYIVIDTRVINSK